MLKRTKTKKRLLVVLGVFFLLLAILVLYMYSIALIDPPVPADKSSLDLKRKEVSTGFYTIGNNWFRKSKSGLYEMYIEGKPFKRGVINGKLAKELIIRQEDHFNEQINKMIPSKFYLHFLKYFVGWFNRHLDENIAEEYKEEIYGISESASDKYDYIGSNYQRILNYHAAHDIGHALQSMALVGCTSFGTWNSRSEEGTMIIGRNFDFYVGDKFSEEKIVSFENPESGYKFMAVTWGGFLGVVSGMNEKGLTVTVNAAKSNVPSGSATPVSIVSREILQYAKNINEALAIASKRKMFVSESFLIGSAEDHKAVVIEKTPDTLDVYDPNGDFILCTNHFQGKILGKSSSNLQQVSESSSEYRYKRLTELLNRYPKNTAASTAGILRDRKGLNDSDIGMGNEKAVDQLIAHHSIIFEPEKLLVWVSTSPWQLGPFAAYDLRKVFSMKGMNHDEEIVIDSLTIPADSFLLTNEYRDFLNYRKFKKELSDGSDVDIEKFTSSNPAYFHTWELAGDYYSRKENFSKAISCYQTALTKEIATLQETNIIKEKLKKCNEKIKN